MENNTPKKLTKAAAIVSLAAALAATPVGADGYAIAVPGYAEAEASVEFSSELSPGETVNVFVSLSFQYAGSHLSDEGAEYAYAELSRSDVEEKYNLLDAGDAVSAMARAMVGDEQVGYDFWS